MPMTPESGAGEEFLKSAARTAGNSAGNKGSAGKSAGSSDFLVPQRRAALLPALFLAFPLFPALFPAVLAALFRNSSPAPPSGVNGIVKLTRITGVFPNRCWGETKVVCQRVVLTNACISTCRFLCLSPSHPPPSPRTSTFPSFSIGQPTPLVAQAPHHLCRATLLALHFVAWFALCTFSQCRTRIALHPLKCLQKALSQPWGGVSHLNFALYGS